MTKKLTLILLCFLSITFAQEQFCAYRTTLIENFQSNEKTERMNPMLKVYAIQTNVTDLEKGVEFYQHLGFDLITKDYFPRVAPLLNDQTMLVLHKVDILSKNDPKGARTTLNMSVKNLDEIINEFESLDFEIVHEEAQTAAIGIWKAVRDPFGNVINLIEHNYDAGSLERPKVNNISIVGTDIDQAVNFYSNILGLNIFSVKYYPVIPLSVEGVITNIALHGTAEKKVEQEYPEGTQTFLVFQVDDLIETVNHLKSQGVEFIYETPQQAAVGIYTAFKDPFGLIHELLEVKKQ